ncbi:MAG: proline dehydrogenase [Candidatus Fluviicola riflensis]|nr:MAG: proline dehydrogenase [Candidatus Fluviicola riflensis]OGS76036.1 MAG: proline dehydrogenase [Candidatus Fluviicola riflensis]OGS81936.1 MAG: proline dehydrogenase [Fluviicola sp. RIFCSPHIGHO2_01_FULL_43_53]OGS83374.1 MAG: proline dehydrogenase [Fluviicola sp. RIFCSPHIGHO2_12_FULL_43_24]
MISFNNTEIAFKHKTNADLRRANFLFSVMASPGLVKAGKGVTSFFLNIGLPIQGMIKATIFKQFCGGETIEECTPTINSMWKNHVGTILDYSVEGKESPEDFEATTNEIIATITKAKNNEGIPFAVFKVTGIAEFAILEKANASESDLSETEKATYNLVVERVNRICKAAYESHVPVFIDAEETWIQDTIDRICHQMMELYNKEKAIVYNTVQMYRHDRLAFLQESVAWATTNKLHYGVKLVRGAYMEKERKRAAEKEYPDPIQPNKVACDKDYNDALTFLVDHIDHIALCAGTHNEDSSAFLADLMEKKGIDKSDKRIYFAQLLGMSDHISYNLAHAGYNVAKYVPYGPVKEVIPYLFRRADENTSVKGQTGRELSLIRQEKQRRRL